jgi:hypothetical protein
MAVQAKPVAMAGLTALRIRRLGYGLATAAALVMVFWSSAPSVRAACAFLVPLRANPEAFQEWAESDESVAPVVARMFIDRRMRIEETLGREGNLPNPTEEATGAEEAEFPSDEPSGMEPVDQDPAEALAPEPEIDLDARVLPVNLPREYTHA